MNLFTGQMLSRRKATGWRSYHGEMNSLSGPTGTTKEKLPSTGDWPYCHRTRATSGKPDRGMSCSITMLPEGRRVLPPRLDGLGGMDRPPSAASLASGLPDALSDAPWGSAVRTTPFRSPVRFAPWGRPHEGTLRGKSVVPSSWVFSSYGCLSFCVEGRLDSAGRMIMLGSVYCISPSL